MGRPEVGAARWGRAERWGCAALIGECNAAPFGARKDLKKEEESGRVGGGSAGGGGERLRELQEGLLGAAVGGILHPESAQSAALQPGAAGAPFLEVPTAVGGP